MKKPVTRLDYCQYLLVSQINYTLTNFADHSEEFSHDAINRYLKGERITPRLVWDNVEGQIIRTPHGYIVFDDTVLDKNYSYAIELVRRQYSGNAHGVVKGIGVVTCIYINPDRDQFWLIDYRIYDPEGDGKSKLDHVREMLTGRDYEAKRGGGGYGRSRNARDACLCERYGADSGPLSRRERVSRARSPTRPSK